MSKIVYIRLNTPYKQNMVESLKDILKEKSAAKALLKAAQIIVNKNVELIK